MADKLLDILSAPAEINGHQVSRTASLGIALSNGSSAVAEELLAHADAALHLSKALGGNQVAVFDTALRASVEQRAETEMQLRDAIEHGGLLLYYQPEVDLRTGQLLAVEALVRWNHPQRGVLPAGSFITVAEETGLIADLGRWVLTEACRQMAGCFASRCESTCRRRSSPPAISFISSMTASSRTTSLVGCSVSRSPSTQSFRM